jgi:hypothetical protein
MGSVSTYSHRHGCSESDPKPADTLTGSVGEKGLNLPDDVRAVQRLLNGVPPANGGPMPPLEVDGLIGPLTKAAISRFQGRHLGWVDGRIDPSGPTLEKLEAASVRVGLERSAGTGSSQPTVFDPDEDPAKRLAMAMLAQRDVRAALLSARLALDALLLAIRNPNALALAPSKKTRFLFDRHFGNVGAREAESVTQVRRTFVDMLSAVDSRRPGSLNLAFADFLDIDPAHVITDEKGHPVYAYVRKPKIKNDRLDKAGVDFNHIYLTKQLDPKPADWYVQIVLHEVGHLATHLSLGPTLVDKAYGWESQYFTLPHATRLINADSYANFAFEMAFGNDRLAAVTTEMRLPPNTLEL